MKTQDRTITIGDYRFNETDHLHELLKNGEYKALTGVTTVLGVIGKPFLIQWAANQAVEYIKGKVGYVMESGVDEETRIKRALEVFSEAKVAHRKKKEAAGDWGTEVHAEVERFINNRILTDQSNTVDKTIYDTRIHEFIMWSLENKVKFLASEKHVYSKDWWVGGICDIICEIDGKRFIGDIKTSSGIYPEAFIQGSAYAKMAVENDLYDSFDGIVIINLKKDGGFDVQFNYDIQGNVKCFEAALTLYRHLEILKN